MKFKRFISGLSAAAIFTISTMIAVPVNAGAAEGVVYATNSAAYTSSKVYAPKAEGEGMSAITMGAGRLTFIQFDLSEYDLDSLKSATLRLTKKGGSISACAVVGIPNDVLVDSVGNMTLDGTSETAINMFVSDENTYNLTDGNIAYNAIFSDYAQVYTDRTSSDVRFMGTNKVSEECVANINNALANGVLRNYTYQGIRIDGISPGNKYGEDISEVIKSVTDVDDSVVTLLVYSAFNTGYDIYDSSIDNGDSRPYLELVTVEPTEEPTPSTEPTEEPTPSAEPTEKPTEKPEIYTKMNISDKAIIRYAKNNNQNAVHTSVNGKSVECSGWTKSILERDASAYLLTDNTIDENSIAKTGSGNNASAFILDLGQTRSVSKIKLHHVSGSAIVGVAGENTEDVNGYLSDDGFVLNRNWARLNESNTKNLVDVEVEYGEKTSYGYDTVTLVGDFGNCRYIVFDGNGSASQCSEIEVFYVGEPVACGITIVGKDKIIASDGIVSETYTALITDAYGENVEGAYKITADTLPTGVSAQENEDGSITISASSATANNASFVLTATAASDADISATKTVIVESPQVTSLTVSGETSLSTFEGKTLTVDYSYVVGDQYGNQMSGADAVWSVDSTNDELKSALSIDNDGRLIFNGNAAAGMYKFTVTAVSADNSGVSGSIEVGITVQSTDYFKIGYSKAIAFRGDTAAGNFKNVLLLPEDSGVKDNEEIQGHSAFAYIARYSLKDIETAVGEDKEIGELNFVVSKTSGTNREIGVWLYDGTEYENVTSGAASSEVYNSVKELLPTWGSTGGYITSQRTKPLASAMVNNDGTARINLKPHYNKLVEAAKAKGYINLLVTTRYYDMKNDNVKPEQVETASEAKLKISLTGSKAPHFEVTTRDKSIPTSMVISGDGTIVIPGDKTGTVYSSQFIAEVYSQHSTEENKDIMNVPVSWSVAGSEFVSIDEETGELEISSALPTGKTKITVNAEYSSDIKASREVTIEKRVLSVITSIKLNGDAEIEALQSELPVNRTYTADVLDQYGSVIENSSVLWSIDGSAEGISISSDGLLTIKEGAKSTNIKLTAASEADNSVRSSMEIIIKISKYPSIIFAKSDIQFRKGSESADYMTGSQLELRNSDTDGNSSDKGFSAALKFDISTIRNALNDGQLIGGIKIRITTRKSENSKLNLKPLSNDWDESDYLINSYENKTTIINGAIAAQAIEINGKETNFTLNNQTKSKAIYDVEAGDNETVSNWQTELDITDYVVKYISENPTENDISFLIVPNYSGTTTNTFYTKDCASSEDWTKIKNKFALNDSDISQMYPSLNVEYKQETVTIGESVSDVPIPISDIANTVRFNAVHYNPVADVSDNEITWSIAAYTDLKGNRINGAPEGVSVTDGGILSVSAQAQSCVIVLKAVSKLNEVIYAEKEIEIKKLAASLNNGSFEFVDKDMMPIGWKSYDPDIEMDYNGVQKYVMSQADESFMASFNRSNDEDGYFSGTHNAEDPTGMFGKKTVKLTGASEIPQGYAGAVYTSNAAIGGSDGGPHIRVSEGMSYWITQDYHTEGLTQLNTSSLTGPYVGIEGNYGTTSKKSQYSETFYIKDNGTTDGYTELQKLITVPSGINRLRVNWGLRETSGSIYYRNFRVTPQGIDKSDESPDGKNRLRVAGKMEWSSDKVALYAGEEYSYKLSYITDTKSSSVVTISFMDTEGNEISSEKINGAKSTVWKELSGSVTAPQGSVCAVIKLTNGTGKGSVWYDNIIFTQTTEATPTYIRISTGNEQIIAPASDEAYAYSYFAEVADQYNVVIGNDVVWSVVDAPSGVTITESGILKVSNAVSNGNTIIRASIKGYENIYAEKVITIVKQAENAENVSIKNGSFKEYNEQTKIPMYWTNAGNEISMANNTFDASINGWKMNYAQDNDTVTPAEMVWDDSVDHTGNAGGSAKIFNAGSAQGSYQIDSEPVVEGGNTYRFTVWVKTDHVASDAAIYALLIFKNATGGTIYETKQLLNFYPSANADGYNTSDWTKLTGITALDETVAKVRIDLRYKGGNNGNNGTVWFDDLSIEKLSQIDMSAYDGEPAIRLTGYGSTVESWNSDKIDKITPGQEYVYSSMIKTANTTYGGYVEVVFYDADGNLISSSTSRPTTANEWNEIKGSVTAPLGAAGAVIKLCMSGKGNVWFSDVRFENRNLQPSSIIIEGDSSVEIPSETDYKVVVTDQHGLADTKKLIPISISETVGVLMDSENGILKVTSDAVSGTNVILSAEYDGIKTQKTVALSGAASQITIIGSSNITVTKTDDRYASFKLKNQDGQDIEVSSAHWSVLKNKVGITIENGVLTVPKGTKNTSVTITAEYKGIIAEKKVSITLKTDGEGNSGGGGGGSNLGGGGTASGVSDEPGRNMGGVIVGTQSTETNSSSQKPINGENIIPQPDPEYFMANDGYIGGFKDIGNVPWAQKAIVSLAAAEIVNGKSEGIFAPNDNITRAEFIKMLIGTFGDYITCDKSKKANFADVDADSWYYESVMQAVESGIVTGISDTEFAPDSLITRQDMAVMVKRLADNTGLNLNIGAQIIFNDDAEISDYASEAVKEMSRAGIITGYEDGEFKPRLNATRAQAAVIVYRLAGGKS